MAHDWEHERFLRLYCTALDSVCFQDPHIWHLWSWLLMTAKREERQTGQERRVNWQGGERTIGRGQVTINYGDASKFFKCSKSTIHRRFRALAQLSQISLESGTIFTIVTIINYSKLQPEWPTKPNATRTIAERLPNVLIESENLRRGESSPPPPVPLNRAELSDERRVRALALIVRCQHIAERILGGKLSDFTAVPKMIHLIEIVGGDEEAVLEVFEHFLLNRRKRSTATFDIFFDYYDQHENALVEAVRNVGAHEQANQPKSNNGSGGR